MDIPYTTHTLPNGLDVVVHEDRHIPMAAVSVWYHVGSRHEQPGRTGFAHLFEHLMFKGSAHHPAGYFEALQEAGGLVNGSTNTDRTNYWEVVPSQSLELALWMESDRMGHLLPALSEEKFTTEREVVLNERRQNYENRPYGLSSVALAEALFAPDHPYSWVTIGAPADLEASSVEDARHFFRTFYHPSNASIAIAGDVDTDDQRHRDPNAGHATQREQVVVIQRTALGSQYDLARARHRIRPVCLEADVVDTAVLADDLSLHSNSDSMRTRVPASLSGGSVRRRVAQAACGRPCLCRRVAARGLPIPRADAGRPGRGPAHVT